MREREIERERERERERDERERGMYGNVAKFAFNYEISC